MQVESSSSSRTSVRNGKDERDLGTGCKVQVQLWTEKKVKVLWLGGDQPAPAPITISIFTCDLSWQEPESSQSSKEG